VAAATAAAREELTLLCRTGVKLLLVLRVLLAATADAAADIACCSCCGNCCMPCWASLLEELECDLLLVAAAGSACGDLLVVLLRHLLYDPASGCSAACRAA
jgi:hypothetical protein